MSGQVTEPEQRAGGGRRLVRAWHGFRAALWRDLFVMVREVPRVLAQTVVQPFFMLLVMGHVLIQIGYVREDYAAILLPGILALTTFLGALQNTALGLVFDFSVTRELEDRLLLPAPLYTVALAKMAFGALRGVLSGVVIVPIGFLVLDLWWTPGQMLAALPLVVLGACCGAAAGLWLGTAVESRNIAVWFAIAVTPLTFTGAIQFPWPMLSDTLWFQMLCALNPLTYLSESLRAVTVPAAPHIPLPIGLTVLVFSVVVAGALGIRGFRARALG
ncbi:ABC transporter permease [Streptomyces bohaiensis]|uniref:Transport permease protein n=1 Tax=Streptomyces bohaiensis TaxID=1431344 RepID=A0ABX1C9V3_9ACTN|nr:ABC transporter permease [Streptomyces bohaiensis]NJQ15041.1 ABC transporter permease [Streptomyces bohaiensis]